MKFRLYGLSPAVVSVVLIGCVDTTNFLPLSMINDDSTSFAYMNDWDSHYYEKKAELYRAGQREPISLNAATAQQYYSYKNPDLYWKMATSEIHSDIRYFMIYQAMEQYRRTYDITPPYDYKKSPAWKPYISYGFHTSVADQLRADGIYDSLGAHAVDNNSEKMYLYFQALLEKYKDKPLYLDKYANQCFSGFGPADLKRSGIHPPSDDYHCEALFDELRRYVPMTTEDRREPSHDDIKFGQHREEFLLGALAAHTSPLARFFEGNAISASEKKRLAKKFIAQIDDMSKEDHSSNPGLSISENEGYLNGDPGFIMALSSNPDYMYGADKRRFMYLGLVDLSNAHNYLQYYLLGLDRPVEASYGHDFTYQYMGLVGGSYMPDSQLTKMQDGLMTYRFPNPRIRCERNLGVQMISFNKVARMDYACRAVEDSQARNLNTISNGGNPRAYSTKESFTMLTVNLAMRRPEGSLNDNYATSFINVHKSVPDEVKEAFLSRQMPNAFVARLKYVDKPVLTSNYVGQVVHQGVVYYFDLSKVKEYLTQYL
jgi:hypothetical protein